MAFTHKAYNFYEKCKKDKSILEKYHKCRELN